MSWTSTRVALSYLIGRNWMRSRTKSHWSCWRIFSRIQENGSSGFPCPISSKVSYPRTSTKSVDTKCFTDHWLNDEVPSAWPEDKFAWRTDEEFAREMLAGDNPVIVSLLQVCMLKPICSDWRICQEKLETEANTSDFDLAGISPNKQAWSRNIRWSE